MDHWISLCSQVEGFLMTDVKLKPLYPHMANRNKRIITPNAGKAATGAKRGKIRASQNKKKTVSRKVCSIRKVNKYSLLPEKVFKLPYVSRLLPLHQWIKSNSVDKKQLFIHWWRDSSLETYGSLNTFSRNNEYLLTFLIKIRARRVTSDVGLTLDWLKRKTNAIHNVCSDWVGESAKPTLANGVVFMKSS